MNDLYVKLAVLDGQTIDDQWLSYSDREYHFKQYFERKTEIEREHIMTTSDAQVVISGVAGAGKTTFVNKIVLSWAQGDFFNGEDTPYIGLLIPIRCRELNNINNETSLFDVIKTIHPKLSFFTKETYDDLREQILIIVDGIDELVGIGTIHANIKEYHAKTLYDFIDPKMGLGKHRIFVGRPRAARMVQSLFQGMKLRSRNVEICGFETESIKEYIRKMFEDNKPLINRLQRKIDTSVTFKAMATVPVYLWAICGLYYQRPDEEIPETVTELLLSLMLLFQQNHWGKKRDSAVSLSDLVKDTKMLQHVKEISAIAFETLREG